MARAAPTNRTTEMPPNRHRGPPMTLANMRENGVWICACKWT
jgi:hypothetical protein